MAGIDVREGPVRHRWLAYGVVLAAVFVDLVDGTMVSVALPRIQADLQAGPAAAQWILAGYTLMLALGLITGGRLGDIYGRRRVFLIGLAAFTIFSAVCGAAPNAEILIVGRLLQGLSAALMVPQAISVVLVLFSQGERAKAFGIFGAVLSLANVSGPILGGLFLQFDVLDLGWRAIFFVNVPLGVLAFIGALWLMPESRSSASVPLRLDLPGVALISLASFALMYPLIQGREAGWPLWMIMLPVVAVVLLLLFGVVERRRDAKDGSALVPPDLLRQRSFAVGLVILLLVFSGLASLFVVLYFALQLGLGWSPLLAAVAGLGFPLGIAATTGVAQVFALTRGRLLIRIGLSIMALATVTLLKVMNTAGADLGFWGVALPILGMGFGMGLCISILTNVVLAGVPDSSAGAGSGVTNAVLQLGAALGVAIVGTTFFAILAATAGGPEDYVLSAALTFWYHVGVFVIAVLLTPFLPRAARSEPVEEAAAAADSS